MWFKEDDWLCGGEVDSDGGGWDFVFCSGSEAERNGFHIDLGDYARRACVAREGRHKARSRLPRVPHSPLKAGLSPARFCTLCEGIRVRKAFSWHRC
ncbi:hypothetical protein GGTG_04248 [Gaeumannomyces tritici R3-111a-1]|uniref:Uncharacterized protein n=1 Tax=Gaeumannomyces tritici (strain R3-111a-1) TaxID=644352 RepID=J3NSJ7_GAET3|nr:hypothetical protein GGTG_04248 [Gaeumannomyces tritici R3-111a-1]EJT79160.1 hypothetical protein GGTG_04248 [Gaeumannomyces tritici R3-111a-1]